MSKLIDKVVGENLKNARLYADLNPKEVTKILGILEKQLYNHEQGEIRVTALEMFHYCELYRCSIAKLFQGTTSISARK